MAKTHESVFGYEDIMELTGLSKNALYQYRVRMQLDPDDLRSIVLFVARHGTPELRRDILNYAVGFHLSENPGDRHHRRRKK